MLRQEHGRPNLPAAEGTHVATLAWPKGWRGFNLPQLTLTLIGRQWGFPGGSLTSSWKNLQDVVQSDAGNHQPIHHNIALRVALVKLQRDAIPVLVAAKSPAEALEHGDVTLGSIGWATVAVIKVCRRGNGPVLTLVSPADQSAALACHLDDWIDRMGFHNAQAETPGTSSGRSTAAGDGPRRPTRPAPLATTRKTAPPKKKEPPVETASPAKRACAIASQLFSKSKDPGCWMKLIANFVGYYTSTSVPYTTPPSTPPQPELPTTNTTTGTDAFPPP